jgi:UBX domain-containing protein 1/4
MDFILEHNDDPIPDPTSGVTATSSTQPHSEPMGEDEDDDDAAALRAAYRLSLNPGTSDLADSASSAGVEARVSNIGLFHLTTR